MNKIIAEFKFAKKNLLQYFDCYDDYLIREYSDYSWKIVNLENNYFVNYMNENNKENTAFIATKDANPLIFRTDDLTMIICIDCIKIAFIFENSKQFQE